MTNKQFDEIMARLNHIENMLDQKQEQKQEQVQKQKIDLTTLSDTELKNLWWNHEISYDEMVAEDHRRFKVACKKMHDEFEAACEADSKRPSIFDHSPFAKW